MIEALGPQECNVIYEKAEVLAAVPPGVFAGAWHECVPHDPAGWASRVSPLLASMESRAEAILPRDRRAARRLPAPGRSRAAGRHPAPWQPGLPPPKSPRRDHHGIRSRRAMVLPRARRRVNCGFPRSVSCTAFCLRCRRDFVTVWLIFNFAGANYTERTSFKLERIPRG